MKGVILMLFKILNNKDLENYILQEISPIREMVDLSYIYFSDNNLGSEEGLYIFMNQQGYHFVYSERGIETTHKVTDNLFEISFWTIRALISDIESDLLEKNIGKVKNQRQYIFEQRLRLLELVGEDYRKVGEAHINEILRYYPL